MHPTDAVLSRLPAIPAGDLHVVIACLAENIRILSRREGGAEAAEFLDLQWSILTDVASDLCGHFHARAEADAVPTIRGRKLDFEDTKP